MGRSESGSEDQGVGGLESVDRTEDTSSMVFYHHLAHRLRT